MNPWIEATNGAIAFAGLVIGLVFLSFWRRSKDRLFLLFGAAFWVLMIERLVLIALQSSEVSPYIYLLRLFAFAVIIGAIIDKNRTRS